jgi:hypothetical protein
MPLAQRSDSSGNVKGVFSISAPAPSATEEHCHAHQLPAGIQQIAYQPSGNGTKFQLDWSSFPAGGDRFEAGSATSEPAGGSNCATLRRSRGPDS